MAYRLAGNDDDAQDLVQEALIRVRKGLERYEPGSLEGWLARIVTNVFLDEVRRRKRRPTDALPDDPDRVLPPAPAADEVPTGLSDEVQAALGDLPDDFRVPVVLCDVSDLSYEQIADATGVPIGTVRSRIHRGRRLLRASLLADGVSGPMSEPASATWCRRCSRPTSTMSWTTSTREAVEARLAASPEWRAELAEVRAAREAVRGLPSLQAPAGFWDRVLANVGAADDASVQGIDAPPTAPMPLRARRSRRRTSWVAAAAAIVVGVVAVIAVPHRSSVTPDVTAVVAQHGAQGSDAGDPVTMLAPVGPLAGFRR